jgi:DNA-binding LacI/PurR family transcriptional regulator
MNIKEVARLAGVSTATVSRTINGSDKVTPETAERVRRAVETLGFFPNNNARALGSGRSGMYGLIISDITNPFFPELVRSFEEVAVQYGQEVLIANTNYDPHRMELCVRRMLQRKVEGVAIMTSEVDERFIGQLSTRGIPIVFLDTGVPRDGVSNIVLDYTSGIDCAVEHLTALGHQRIGFISGPMNLKSARTRYQAFTASLRRAGIEQREHFVQEGNHRMDGGREAMTRMLDHAIRPTAILASNDLSAIGAMGAIFEHGLRVPADISVVGFDDIEISAFTQPALTTVRISRPQIARVAFHALFDSSDRNRKGNEYTLATVLIERKSTAQVAKGAAPS